MYKTKFQCFFFFILVSISLSAHAELFTYKLKFVQASQVIPVMQPHLASNSVLTGKQYQLFADVSEEDNQKIVSMLAQLDKQLTQYLVEVKIINRKLDKWERKATKVYKNSQPKTKRYSTDSLNKSNQHFQLRLLEGHQGFVNTGESFPTHQIVIQHNKFLPKTSHKRVSSGFYVVVRESKNNQVVVNVSTNVQQRKGTSKDVNFSSATSQIMGTKGEWILLASTGEMNKTRTPNSYSTSSMNTDKKWYYVRVND